MAKTLSEMIPLGTKAPDFELPDTISGKPIRLKDVASDIATVVLFLCNHCPYVIYIEDALVALVNRYQEKGIHFVGICSNDAIAYPADSPEKMHEHALFKHFPFPYLFDETQDVARAYHAKCTPDIFVFDQALRCVYRGRFDESTPGNHIPATGSDLQQALDAILSGQPVSEEQKPSIGCNIKWK